MKIRLISGTCYIAILAAFFCLKIFVHDFCFDALIYAFALIGTFEMLRAVKDRTTKRQNIVVAIYSVVCIPATALFEYYYGIGFYAAALCTLALAVLLLIVMIAEHEKTSLESVGVALFSAIYPTLLLSVMVVGNHLTPSQELLRLGIDSRLFILFVFVISPCADSIAYVFGRFLRKYFPKKMAPKLSPNKTVIGGIGGLVGGLVGALVLYFIYGGALGSYTADAALIWIPVYLLIGLVGAVATAVGDLVESCIKRKVGIKDMGKIMPGHGGVLDRIDGTLFASLAVYLVFIIVYMFA